MTTEVLAFIFGCTLVLIGIIGGGFEVKELKIPKVGWPTRVFAIIGGIVFISLGIELPDLGKPITTQLSAIEPKQRPGPPIDRETAISADKLVGSWEGKFVVREHPVTTVYTFNEDGSFSEVMTDAFDSTLDTSAGHYTYQNGQVNIKWLDGVAERGAVDWAGENKFRYRIILAYGSSTGRPRTNVQAGISLIM